MKTKPYPEMLRGKWDQQLEHVSEFFSDLNQAIAYAIKTDEQLYTCVDAGGTRVRWMKGNVLVNRLNEWVVVKDKRYSKDVKI